MTMRERPIPFKATMVRAILDGRKTQTRRIVKASHWRQFADCDDYGKTIGNWEVDLSCCPYGQPGDRLWVRETCRQVYPITPYSHGIVYRADAPRALGMDEYSSRHKWTPSIHMPRWASRITLEITDVRVQRVQDIGEAGATAEGLATVTKDGTTWKFGIPDADGLPGTDDIGWPWTKWDRDPRKAFATLWNDTYGPDAWDRNDWVWAVSFKRVAP